LAILGAVEVAPLRRALASNSADERALAHLAGAVDKNHARVGKRVGDRSSGVSRQVGKAGHQSIIARSFELRRFGFRFAT